MVCEGFRRPPNFKCDVCGEMTYNENKLCNEHQDFEQSAGFGRNK